MPANIRIIHAHDFIKANPEGEIDLDESKKLLIDIAIAADPLLDYDIVIDTRKAHSGMSVTNLWYLAAELSSHTTKTLSRTQKIAILCPIERFDYAEFLSLCANNRGFQVSAFTSFEDAYEWLIGIK